jgi:hypothetical protein
VVAIRRKPPLHNPTVVAISKQPLTPSQLIFTATVTIASGFMAIHAVRGIVSLEGS